MFPKVVFTIRLFAASLLFQFAAHAEDLKTHVNVSALMSRLLGQPGRPGDTLRNEVLTIIQQGKGSLEAYTQAALKIVEHRDFVHFFLRPFFGAMNTLNGKSREVGFVPAVALQIAKTIQPPRDFRNMFTANETCRVSLNGTITEPEAVAESTLSQLDLRSSLVCTPGQAFRIRNGANITVGTLPASEAAGFLTLGYASKGFASAVFSGGTNLRFVYFLTTVSFGPDRDLNALQTAEYPDTYVGPFITRNPRDEGYEAGFRQDCNRCHGLMGGMVPCYHWSSDETGLIFTPSPDPNTTRCNGSVPDRKNIYPGGYVRNDNSWRMLFTPTQKSAYGMGDFASTGAGLNAMMQTWKTFRAIYEYQVRRLGWGEVGVCQGIPMNEFSAAAFNSIVDELHTTGNLMRAAARMAAHCILAQ